MILTDTIKLSLNNGNLIWKIMLYVVFGGLLIGGLAVVCCYGLVNELINAGIFAEISALFSNSFFNLHINDIMINISEVIYAMGDILVANAMQVLPLLILLFVIVGVLGSFVFNLMHIPTTECIYGYMGSFSRLGFSGCFIKHIKLSIKYALARTLVVLPYNIIMLGAILGSMKLYGLGGLWGILASFVVILVIVILYSIRNVLFGNWATSIVVQRCGVWVGLRDSVKDNMKVFKNILPMSMAFVLIVVALNMAGIMFTAGVGLFLTIPCGILMMFVFNNMMYFYGNGLRFYIDKDTIVSPRKIENYESISSLKDII